MKLILILGLVLVGLFEMQLSSDLKTKKEIMVGEVKGEEVTIHKFSEPAAKNSAPSFPPPSPHPQPSPASTPKPEVIPQTAKEIILLDKQQELKNETLKIALPELDTSNIWYLELELGLSSTEDVLGFDSPGFTIHVDDYLVYQRSFFEDGPDLISFNVAAFSNIPQSLSIWSGNTGDELKDTYSTIKKIRLIPKDNHDFIETEVINDLSITVDTQDYLTLEWSSPQTNDNNLEKPLAYEIRYSSELITLENWFQAKKVEMLLPSDFSPPVSGSKEIALIKAPPLNSGYLAIRSIDSAGILSPLGEIVPFKVKD
jgi:hypothetical protein